MNERTPFSPVRQSASFDDLRQEQLMMRLGDEQQLTSPASFPACCAFVFVVDLHSLFCLFSLCLCPDAKEHKEAQEAEERELPS